MNAVFKMTKKQIQQQNFLSEVTRGVTKRITSWLRYFKVGSNFKSNTLSIK